MAEIDSQAVLSVEEMRLKNITDTMQVAQKIVDGLAIDFQQFTMEDFLAAVGESRKRQIFSFAIPMPPFVYGAWITDEERPYEYIFYDTNLSPLHQVHVQLHEVGHLLCGHETLRVSGQNLTQLIEVIQTQNLSSEASSLLMRATTDTGGDEREEEAEAIATTIQSHVIQAARMKELSVAVSNNTQIQKLLYDMGLS